MVFTPRVITVGLAVLCMYIYIVSQSYHLDSYPQHTAKTTNDWDLPNSGMFLACQVSRLISRSLTEDQIEDKKKSPQNKQELKIAAVQALHNISTKDTKWLVGCRLQTVIDCKSFAARYSV